jgi:hypothetical protein
MQSSVAAPSRYYTPFIITFCLLFFPYLSAVAQEISFTDILVTNNAGQILVYARATSCFTKKVEAAILAGVPTTLVFYLDLYRERPYWWDQRLSRAVIKHTIKYDNVAKNFHISSTNGQQEAATFPNLENAKRVMTDLNGLAVYPVKALAKDESYYLKMKATRKDQPSVPFNLEYFSFFSALQDYFGMGWQEQKISYRSLTTP